MPRTRFEHADPILSVTDMQASRRYDIDVLGFTEADWGSDDFTLMTRDGASIYLSQRAQGLPGTWVWIGVESVPALYEEYMASGALIQGEPDQRPWAIEMIVKDPDGHVLRFGSDATG
jgi:hypothetical protein